MLANLQLQLCLEEVSKSAQSAELSVPDGGVAIKARDEYIWLATPPSSYHLPHRLGRHLWQPPKFRMSQNFCGCLHKLSAFVNNF